MLPEVDLPTATPVRASAGKLDGFFIQEAALNAGVSLELFPDDVLVLSSPGRDTKEISFVRGVPASSTLSGVSYIQERRIRRAILERAGLPVPIGATFSVRRGLPGARRYAKRVGFPVVVKAARGAGTCEIFSGLQDVRELNRVLKHFSVPPAVRPEYVRPVIAPPEFVPAEGGGRESLPSSYRVLVEKDRPGIYVRALVISGDVHSVIECLDGPWATESAQFSDITQNVDPELLQMAGKVVEAVPGVEVLAVDFLLDDPRQPLQEQSVEVVEVSEQPWLYVQNKVSVELARSATQVILQTHYANSLMLEGIGAEHSVQIHAKGVTAASDFAEILETEVLPTVGLEGITTWVDDLAGQVQVEVTGNATELTYLAQSLVDGSLDGLHCVHLLMEPEPS